MVILTQTASVEGWDETLTAMDLIIMQGEEWKQLELKEVTLKKFYCVRSDDME